MSDKFWKCKHCGQNYPSDLMGVHNEELCRQQKEKIKNMFVKTERIGEPFVIDNCMSRDNCKHLKDLQQLIDGKTNYYVLCEEANREIEKLKEDLRRQDTSLLLANQNLEQDYTALEQKIEKAIEILKDSANRAPTCRVNHALEVLTAK